MKRQRHVDRPDDLGEMPPELVRGLGLAYPEGLEEGTHYYDPLTPLVGPISDVTPQSVLRKKKSKRNPKSNLGPLTDAQVAESRARRVRYDTYINELVQTGGDTVAALARTYGVFQDEVRENLAAYKTDVATGMASCSVSDLLEEAGLGKAARVGILRKHAYNADPKVSLVATKLAMDLDGDKHDRGTSYETYLRLVLNKESA
jgi:hypothetical protein